MDYNIILSMSFFYFLYLYNKKNPLRKLMKRNIDEMYCGFGDGVYGSPDEIVVNGRTVGWKDNCIAFAWFPTRIDSNKRIHDFKFIKGSNVIHTKLAEKACDMMLGNAKRHISEKNVSRIIDGITLYSSIRGRLWVSYNVIAFYDDVSSSAVSDLASKLGISDLSKYTLIVGEDRDVYNMEEYIEHDMDGFDVASNEGRIMSMITQKDLDKIEYYNTSSSKQEELSKKLGKMTIAQYNSIIHPYESKESVGVMDESYEGSGDVIYDNDSGRSFNWKSDDAIPFIFLPTDLDGNYKLFIGEGGSTHISIATEAADNIIGKAKDMVSYDYRQFIINQVYSKGYGKGRYWSNVNVVSFWIPPTNDILKTVARRLKLDYDNCEIVYDSDGMTESVTLREYMNDSSIEKDSEEDSIKPIAIDKKIGSIIRQLNDVGDDEYNGRYKDLGNMTIAQYRSIIYPYEGKKSNKVMKENIKSKYAEEISNYTSLMNEALKRDDFKAYDTVKSMLDEVVCDMKESKSLRNELNTCNFGILNHIFEQELPRLIKTNKKAVRDVLKLIKEDKTLSSEFKYYNTIKNINETISSLDDRNVNVESLVKEYADSMRKSMNLNESLKSNKKFRKTLIENNVIPSEHISDEMKTFYKASTRLLENAQSIKNAASYNDDLDTVVGYARRYKKDAVSKVNPIDEISNYESSLKDKLTESEMSFVKSITDFKTPIAEQRKERLFNKFKNECISKIDEMLSKEPKNEELSSLRKQIEEQKFNKNSIVKDIAKLLEIRDILMDD